MANKDSNEVSLMKGVCCKLNDDTCLTLVFFAHTESHARNKSEYFYGGRIDKISDLENEANTMLLDENRVKPWSFPGLTKYSSIVYDNNDTNAKGAAWYKNKLKKIVSWDDFLKIVNGYKATKKTYNDNAKYVVTDYVSTNGVTLDDITIDKSKLIALVGQQIFHFNNKTKIAKLEKTVNKEALNNEEVSDKQ